MFAGVAFLEFASLSERCRNLETGEGDLEGRRRGGGRGERLLWDSGLVRWELGGETLRAGAGERRRGGERDVARFEARLRLLTRSRVELCLYDLCRELSRGDAGRLSDLRGEGLLGDNSRLGLLSCEIDLRLARCAAGL